jgi:hypothetical protein
MALPMALPMAQAIGRAPRVYTRMHLIINQEGWSRRWSAFGQVKKLTCCLLAAVTSL